MTGQHDQPSRTSALERLGAAPRLRRRAPKSRRRSSAGTRPIAARSTCASPRDGTWFYNGTPIGRPALVKLFASDPAQGPGALRSRHAGRARRHHGRGRAVPAVEMAVEGEGDGPAHRLPHQCRRPRDASTPDHPLRFEREPAGGLKPYVRVRGGLWARVTRALAYDLVALGEERDVDGAAMFGVAVGGRVLPDRAGQRDRAGWHESGPADGDARTSSRRGAARAPAAASRPAVPDRARRPARRSRASARRAPIPPRVAAEARRRAGADRRARATSRPCCSRERAAAPARHSGQIAFPGGRVDAGRERRSTPRCARPRRRSASTAASCGRSAILDPYLTDRLRIMPGGRRSCRPASTLRSTPRGRRPPSRCRSLS